MTGEVVAGGLTFRFEVEPLAPGSRRRRIEMSCPADPSRSGRRVVQSSGDVWSAICDLAGRLAEEVRRE